MAAERRIGVVLAVFAVSLGVSGFVTHPGECVVLRPCGCQIFFRQADGGLASEARLAETGEFLDMVPTDGTLGRLFFVMVDGGWSVKSKGWTVGGMPYLVPFAGAQRTFLLPDGGRLTEAVLEDGGSVCFPLTP